MHFQRRRVLQAVSTLAAALAMRPASAQSSGIVSRPIPASGEHLPLIGLGTWQVFDVGNDRAARAPLREVLDAFAKSGGRMIDSSPMYGTSESVVGDLVAELGLAGKLFVATKVRPGGRHPADGDVVQAAARADDGPDADS